MDHTEWTALRGSFSEMGFLEIQMKFPPAEKVAEGMVYCCHPPDSNSRHFPHLPYLRCARQLGCASTLGGGGGPSHPMTQTQIVSHLLTGEFCARGDVSVHQSTKAPTHPECRTTVLRRARLLANTLSDHSSMQIIKVLQLIGVEITLL